MTAPDNILVSGWLKNGAVVSSHVAAIPYAGSGYRMEIYGRDGTLVASGEDSPQLSKVFLHGAQRGNKLEPIAVPERFTVAAPGTPDGEPLNVGQMYSLFARAIRGERRRSAGFRDRGRSAPAGRCDQAGVGYRAGGPFRLSRRGFFAATPTPTLPASGEGGFNADGGGRIASANSIWPPCLQISLPRLRGRAGWGYSACNSAKLNQPRAARIAAHTRSGVAGMSSCLTPSGASASSTALMTAGSAPTVPASPAPLAPKGLSWVGHGVALDLQVSGMSSARGIA